ncbi:MAG: HYR domain-containing protein [Saprospiraceae bacterium]|nr:HYR domain-containing protein [Saprospiraceae bacterium]
MFFARIFFAIALAIGLSSPGFTQSLTFQKRITSTAGQRANDILAIADGYIIVGTTPDPNTHFALATLTRTDGMGQVLWQKTYGGQDDASFNQVAAANDGGFIAWGNMHRTNQGHWEAWLVKVDDAGQLLWQKTIGEPGFNETGLSEIIPMPDGYILSGTQTKPGYSQTFVVRVNNAGETQWSRFTPSDGYNALKVQYLADSVLYLAGTVNDLGCRRMMDPANGNILSSQEYRVDTNSWVQVLRALPDGSQLLVGTVSTYTPGLGRLDGWLQKMSPSGQVLWSKSYKVNITNTLSTACVLPDGSVVMGLSIYPWGNNGTFQLGLIKIDPAGNVLWARSFGNNGGFGFLSRIAPAADGGLIAVGYINSAMVQEPLEAIFLKTDSMGIVDGCCVANLDVVVTDRLAELLPQAYSNEAFENMQPFQEAVEGEGNAQSSDFCSYNQPVRTDTIRFCPGSAVVLGDSSYTQPTTVLLKVASTGMGCDTLATFVLEFKPQATVQQTAYIGPGDAVTIAGTVYTQPGSVEVWLPASDGGCDTLATYVLLPDSLACAQSVSFLKKYQKNFVPTGSRILVPASDGTLYLFGYIQSSLTSPKLMKVDVDGHVLWTRRLDFLAPDLPYNFSMIEDSEQRLVGFGNYSGSSDQDNQMYAFRYDPATNQLLWFQHFAANQHCTASWLAEMAPGGNFLACDYVQPDANTSNSEIWQLDRQTGTLVAGRVWRYDTKVQMRAGFVHDGAFFATGLYADPFTAQPGLGISKIDATTGAHLWTQFSQTNTVGLEGQDIRLDQQGALVAIANHGGRLWIQKSNLDGSVQWLRRYEVPASLFLGFAGASLCIQPDGYVVAGFSTLADGNKSMILLKVNLKGDLQWARQLKNTGNGSSLSLRQTLAAQGDGLFFAATYSRTPSSSDGMWFGKTDLSGRIDAACSGQEDVPVQVFDETTTLQPIILIRIPPNRNLTAPMRNVVSDELPPFVTACASCKLPCSDILTNQQIGLYPGQAVVLDGQSYTAPAVVTVVRPAPGGCDSILTYQLELLSSQITLQCPADISVVAPANTSAVSVVYALPTAVTDCPDGSVVLNRIQGLASGEPFPIGTHTVCYEAANACGLRDTCCFEIRVDEQLYTKACDSKTAGCLDFELLQVSRDAAQNWVYRVRVTPHCNSAVQFVYLGLPQGISAIEPDGAGLYTSPGGGEYALRSPNFSPFYSLRFKPVSGGLAAGQSAVFRYVLPAQTGVSYIHVAARLLNGGYVEAYLNTFNCPVGLEAGSAVPRAEVPAEPASPTSIRISPNPAGAGTLLQLEGTPVPQGDFVLRDLTGRLVFRAAVTDNTVLFNTETGVAGMYVFEVSEGGKILGIGKLVVF